MDLKVNFRSLHDVVVCQEADAPAVLRAVTPAVPLNQLTTDGTVANYAKSHVYVRLDSLPKELADRVRTALESLSWG